MKRTPLTREYTAGRLDLTGACAELADPRAFVRLKQQLYRHDWVIYAKRPFAGASQVFRYLGRYTHRVGLSNHRLLKLQHERRLAAAPLTLNRQSEWRFCIRTQ